MRPDISSFKILTFRTFILFTGCTFSLCGSETNAFDEVNIKTSKLKLLLLRSTLGCITIGLLIYSIKYMNVSDVYTIFYCYPMLVILMSLFTKDKPKLLDYLCLVACIIGATLIIRPAFIFQSNAAKPETLFYFMLAFFAAFSKSLEMLIVRNIKDGIHFLFFPLLYSTVGILLFPIPLMLFDNFTVDFKALEWFLLACMAIVAWGYHAFMALSLRSENVGRASLINYFQIPILLIVDLVFFGKAIVPLDIIGASLIFSFNLVNGYFKLKERETDLNNFKNKDAIANN